MRWTFKLDGVEHTLEMSYLTGKLKVDGQPVKARQTGETDLVDAVLGFGATTKLEFDVEGHSCVFRQEPTIDKSTQRYRLVIDGRSRDLGSTPTHYGLLLLGILVVIAFILLILGAGSQP